MTSVKSDVGILTQEWVQKFHFENKVDLNLQIPSENESIKIEVGDIPVDHLPKLEFSTNTTTTTSNDSYLQSILSSSSPPASNTSGACTGSQTCACYKCQRQRRRAGINRTNTTNPPNVYTPLSKIKDDTSSRTTEYTFSFTSPPKQAPVETPATSTPTNKMPTIFAPSKMPVTSTPTNKVPTTPTPTSKVSITSTSTNKATAPISILTPPVTPASSPQPRLQKSKRSNTLRKTPTLKSYEKHMPRPAYSQQDSIYRIEQAEAERAAQRNTKKARTSSLTDQHQQQQDNYQISWTEEGTGDDLLTSLVTFQTIFEEKGNDNEGLSDLLEQRAREIKYQKLREQQEAMRPKSAEADLPPRQSDCLTLSYRNGPRHNSLTLYHTMKMKGSGERLQAYNLAFEHCTKADSGMRAWLKKPRTPPARENSKLIQPARKPTVKRSLLHPLSSKRNRIASEELLWSASTENLGTGSASIKSDKSAEMVHEPAPLIQPNDQLTDVISAAHALLPNQQFSANATPLQQQNKVPYEHIDTPGRPRQSSPTSQSTNDFKDNSSVSSSESANGTGSSSTSPSKLKKSRPGRLFSSLGRKTSMRSHHSSSNKPSSIRSLEKIDSHDETQEKVLDELCRILPHIERSQLLPYVQEANNDYMTALQLCKAAVISGKLS